MRRVAMFMNAKFNNQSGQTLIEVVVALALGIVIIVALVGLGTRANRSVNLAKVTETASKFAQEGQEIVRQIRNQNGPVLDATLACSPNCRWSDLYTTSVNSTYHLIPSGGSCTAPAGQWCLGSGGSGDALTLSGVVLEREITISDTNPAADECFIPEHSDLELDSNQVKSAQVLVTWEDPTGPHEINLQSCVTRRG